MHIKEINPQKRPDLFFLEDPLNAGVFDQTHLEDTTVSNGKGLIRRAKAKAKADTPVNQMANARIETITGKDHFFVDLYYDGDLVATYEIQPQYWFNDAWEFQEVTGTVEIDNEAGRMTCSGVQGGFSWDVWIHFSSYSKWRWAVTAPGFTVRLAWIIDFTALGQQMLADGDLKLDYSDYSGNISDDEGVVTRTIIFEPDGVDATSGWVVDPYLGVDEQSDSVDVFCDGYYIRIYHSTATITRSASFFDYNDNELYRLVNVLDISEARSFHFDSSRTGEVIINTPTYVVVRQSGDLYQSADTNAAGSTFTVYWHIYPDRFIQDIFMTPDSTITLDAGFNGTIIGLLERLSGTPNGLYENDPTESDMSNNTDYSSSNYTVTISSGETVDIDMMMIPIYSSLSGGAEQYLGHTSDGYPAVFWSNGDLNYTSTQRLTCMIIVDCEARDNGDRLYDLSDRLAEGDRWVGVATDATINTGTAVTDMNIPDNLDTDGLSSDGARHVESDSNDAGKITFGQAEKKPALVIQDWTLKSGSTPDEHLVGYWKCDDADADTTIDDSSGNGYSGTLQGGNTLNNLDSTDAVRGTSLLLDGTDDYLDFDTGVDNLTDDDKFTISVKCKPNFSYNTASDQPLISIGASDTDRLYLHYDAGSDIWNLHNDINNVGEDDTIGSAYTSDNDLKQWHTIMMSVDLTNNMVVVAIDGSVELALTDVDDAWQATVDFLNIGADNESASNKGAYYIDEVKLYDACILPFGGYHIGNGAGLLADISNPNSDLICFTDFQAATNGVAYGSGLGSVKNSVLTGSAAFTSGAALVGTYGLDTNGGDDLYIPVSNSDCLNPKKGAVGIWINFQTVAIYKYIFGFGDGDDSILLYLDASQHIICRYEAATVIEEVQSTIVPTAGLWYWIVMSWDDTNGAGTGYLKLFVNNIKIGEDLIANAWDGITTGNLYTAAWDGTGGVDAYFGRMFITNNPNTPQIWTNFGKPLWLPLVQDNN